MNSKNEISFTMICPNCRTKQTAFVFPWIRFDQHNVKCVVKICGHVLTAEELQNAYELTVADC